MRADAIVLALALAVSGSARALPPRESASTYFPTIEGAQRLDCDAHAHIPMLDAFESSWYSEHLAAAGEPALYSGERSRLGRTRDAIRFIWLRSFHPTVIVRVDGASSEAPVLVARQLSGAGGYGPGRVAREMMRPLTTAERDLLREAIRRTRPFDAPTHECTYGLDGAEWIMERADIGGYRLVKRWSPEDGPVREMGMTLLGMTGWTFDPIY